MELPDLRRLLLDAMGGRQSGTARCPRRARPLVFPCAFVRPWDRDGKTDGAVLMFIDIDAAKRGLDFAEAIVETGTGAAGDPEPETCAS